MALRIFIFISELTRPAMCVFIAGSFLSNAQAQIKAELLFENGRAISVRLDDRTACENDSSCYVTIAGKATAMFGKWDIGEEASVFTPTISFTSGKAYQVFKKNKLVASFEVPLKDHLVSLELSVFPTADTLPANLLKMYFQFSEPMAQLRSERFVFLLSEEGDTLREVFQSLHPELWNELGDRLTLWVDPGRVKRELIRNQKLGAPFIPGKKYKLLVTNIWKSQNGNSMTSHFEKVFYVGRDDRKKINPKEWLVEVPAAQTKDPLKVHFGESLDWVLVQEGLAILNQQGNQMPLAISISEEQTNAQLNPKNSWKAGGYRLSVNPKLEDLAGNNLDRLFDEDLENQSTKSSWQLEFIVR